MQQPDIGRKHPHAVAVMPGKVGAHQVIRDVGGFAVVAAHAAGNQNE